MPTPGPGRDFRVLAARRTPASPETAGNIDLTLRTLADGTRAAVLVAAVQTPDAPELRALAARLCACADALEGAP